MYLKTQAAVKVLDRQLSNEDLEIFLSEARNTARLVHPHILRTLDFGIHQNIPFLVMEYVPNGTLRQHYPKGERLPLDAVVSYTKQVSDALQYIHNKNLIHRDIKPENMLLGQNNNILLSDFGIAMLNQNLDIYSNTFHEIAGTYPYMAPEQIQGKPCLASDQYSLGVVVYEWLCGEQPFTGRNTEDIISMHLSVPPPSLRTKVPTLPLTAEQVIFKALSKQPDERYASIKEFALALEQASQPGQALLKQDLQEDLLASPSIPAILGSIISSYSHHSDSVTDVAWSPDGKRIASASYDQTVQVWNPINGRNNIIYCGHTDVVNTVAWSPDNLHIASGGKDKTVQVLNAITGKRIILYQGHTDEVNAVTWSPDGTYVVSAGEDTTVQISDAFVGSRFDIYLGHTASVNALAWSPNGMRIASGSKDKTIKIWDVTTKNNVFTYQGHNAVVNSLAWSPDSTRIASGSSDNAVQIWKAVGQADKVDKWGQSVIRSAFAPLSFGDIGHPTMPALGNAPPPPSPFNPPQPAGTPYSRTLTNWEFRSQTNVSRAPSSPRGDTTDLNEILLSLFAIARTSFEEDKVIVGEAYSVQAGISQNKPEGFKGESFDLPVPAVPELLTFDILIQTSENIELTTEWHKTLLYDTRNPDPQLVEFSFQVLESGQNSLIIDFYRKRRWLNTIRLEFEVIEPLQFTASSSEV